VRRPWRWVAAGLTGLPYVVASYFAEASFKEVGFAVLVLAFVLGLRDLRPERGVRAGVPLGLLAVACVLGFGVRALAWPGAVLGCLAAAELIALGGRRWLRWARRLLPALAAAVAIVTAGVLLELPRLLDLTATGTFPAQGGANAGGNFVGDVSPRMVSGAWLSADFRFAPGHELRAALASWFALIAAAYGAVWWLSRRDLVVPVAVVGTLIVFAISRPVVAPYFSTKALAVAAPLVMLMTSRALLAGPALRSLSRRRLVRAAPRLAAAGAFLVLAGWSSLLALRAGSVASLSRPDELIGLRALLERGPTVFLGSDDYLRWELFGVPLSSPSPYHFRSQVHTPTRPPKPPHSPFDFDSVDPALLDRFRYLVTVRGAYGSVPSPAWRRVRTTPSYAVYERRGRTGPRAILPQEHGAPGATLDCAGARPRGNAVARVAPVEGPTPAWRAPGGGVPVYDHNGWAILPAGDTLAQAIALPPGRWELALAYQSPVELSVRAGARTFDLPASGARSGELWRVGVLDHGGGPLEVSVHARAARRGLLRRNARIQLLAAVPPDRGLARLALERACGRYVDWLRPRA
jgi:hypothetical protein